MRTLLINPLQPKIHLDKGRLPLGLAYIGAVVRKKHEIEVLDINLHRMSEDEVKHNLEKLLPKTDVVLSGGLSNDYKYIKWLCKVIKSIKKDVKIILGGIVVTYSPELVIMNFDCDVVVIGEGEKTIEELLDFIEKGKDINDVNGIGYKKYGEIIITEPRERITDLDSIPFPAWELFSDDYLDKFEVASGSRKNMNLYTVRGCPYRCKFCTRMYDRKIIVRSPENVIAEIKELKRKYGVTYISFGDNLFSINYPYIKRFCELLKKENLGIEWNCSIRVNNATDNFIKKLKEGGCILVNFGIESGCQRILDNMQKDQTIKQIVNAIRVLRKNKMNFVANFMIGYPGEDKESIEETTKFRVKYNLLGGIGFVTAYPGSELYEEAKSKGLIKDEDKYLDSLSYHIRYQVPLINFTNFSDEELMKLRDESLKKINRRFVAIVHRIYKFFRMTGIYGIKQLLTMDTKESYRLMKRLLHIGKWDIKEKKVT